MTPTQAPAQAHPVKVERHDTAGMQHHTNTGVREVHTYRQTPHGLFVARDFVDHPRVRHWQAHLLPALHLVVCLYDFHVQREHDYYLDIAHVHQDGAVWTVQDHYLDIVIHDGRTAELLDEDELHAACAAGFISDEDVYQAQLRALVTLDGLHHARYRLPVWLAGQGVQLDWLPAPRQVAPAQAAPQRLTA